MSDEGSDELIRSLRGVVGDLMGPPSLASPPVDLPAPVAPPRARSTGAFETLEDLWAQYPTFGKGGALEARVERVQPTHWEGTAVAGYLGSLQQPITTDEFAATYGGTRYCVTMYEHQMQTGVRTRGHSCVFMIPGSPRMGSYGKREETMAGTMHVVQSAEPSAHAYSYIDKQAERTQASLQSQLAANYEEVKVLRQQLFEAQQSYAKSQAALHEMRADLESRNAQQRAEFSRQLAEADSVRVREAREKFEADLRAAKEDYRDRLDDLEKRHAAELRKQSEAAQTELNRVRDTLDKELAHVRDQAERERTRMREEHQTALSRESDAHRTRIAELQQQHQTALTTYTSQMQSSSEHERRSAEQRIQSLTENHSRDLEAMRRQHDDMVSRLRESFDNERRSWEQSRDLTEKVTRSSSDTQISAMRSEMKAKNDMLEMRNAELQRRIDELSDENRKLSREVHKPLMEQIETVRATAQMLGFGEGGKSRDDEEDEAEEAKPKTLGERLMATAEQVLPVIVDKFSAASAAGAQQQQQQQAAFMQQQQQQAAFMQQRQLAAQQQQPMMRGAPVPAPAQAPPPHRRAQFARRPAAWESATAPRYLDEPLGNVPLPEPPPPPPPVRHEEPARPAKATEGFVGVAPPPPPAASQAAQAPEPSPPPALAVAGQEPPQPPPNQDLAEGVDEFAKQLEQAAENEVVTPKMFARALLERVGPEVLGQVMTMLSPEVFVSEIRAVNRKAVESGDKAPYPTIASARGKKYLMDVWREAGTLLNGDEAKDATAQ